MNRWLKIDAPFGGVETWDYVDDSGARLGVVTARADPLGNRWIAFVGEAGKDDVSHRRHPTREAAMMWVRRKTQKTLNERAKRTT